MSFSDAVKNLSIILVNSHFSQGNVRPNVPAIIEIGGIQVKSTPSLLPSVRLNDLLIETYFKNIELFLEYSNVT